MRQFVVTYDLALNTIMVFELQRRNSGRPGGLFLVKGRHRRPEEREKWRCATFKPLGKDFDGPASLVLSCDAPVAQTKLGHHIEEWRSRMHNPQSCAVSSDRNLLATPPSMFPASCDRDASHVRANVILNSIYACAINGIADTTLLKIYILARSYRSDRDTR